MRLPGLSAAAPAPPAPGLYAFERQGADGARVRAHLRVHDDGSGLLLVNADRALHLNRTAAWMALLALEGTAERQAAARIARAYRVRRATALADFRATRDQVEALLDPRGPCPIHDLALEVRAPFSSTPAAPYRMDLALTYRCNNDCPHCYNARPRTHPELDTEAWRRMLDLLWDVGVPHICFTGGEATLRGDLPDLVAHAEARGQITGLLTNGRRLADRGYTNALRAAGLDHVQVTLESHAAEVHDGMVAARGAWSQTVRGVRNALETGLYVMTNTTLLAENAGMVLETLDFLAELGVPTVGLNALIYAGRGATVGTGLPESALGPLLEQVRERTDRAGQRLIWYTPTQYCHFDPVQMELGVKGCTAARYNMCVEPDGAVLPCQSYYRPLGNLRTDPWPSIWNHDLARWLRERRYVPAGCAACPVLAECGGGCPLTLEAGAVPRPAAIAGDVQPC